MYNVLYGVIRRCRWGIHYDCGSLLIRLRPTQKGLLRVDERLQCSTGREKSVYSAFHSKLLARDAHHCTLHGGISHDTESSARLFLDTPRSKADMYRDLIWLLARLASPVPVSQLMADLPELGVQQCRTFLLSGVDFAGPNHPRVSRGLEVHTYKGYIAVFVRHPWRLPRDRFRIRYCCFLAGFPSIRGPWWYMHRSPECLRHQFSRSQQGAVGAHFAGFLPSVDRECVRVWFMRHVQ